MGDLLNLALKLEVEMQTIVRGPSSTRIIFNTPAHASPLMNIVFHELISNSVPPFAVRFPSLLTDSRTIFEVVTVVGLRIAAVRWSTKV